MKREITIFLQPKKEGKKQRAEEVTLYGRGAGLYAYLNVLAEALSAPRLDRGTFQIHQ